MDLPLDMLVLGLLMRGPGHGYRLYSEYQEILAGIWDVGRSRFYAGLTNLPARGMARKRLEAQAGRPSKTVYSITANGRRRFLAWIDRPVSPMRAVRAEFLAKLRLIAYLDLPNLRRLLAAQKREASAALVTLERAARHRAHAAGDDFEEILFAFRVRQGRAVLQWLSFVEERAGSRTKKSRHAAR